MSMWYSTKKSPLCCGTLQFGRFKFNKPTNQDIHTFIQLKGNELDGYAFGQAEFSNDSLTLKENKEAFAELCDKYELLFKSEPRINKAHTADVKNKVFMAVFKARAKT